MTSLFTTERTPSTPPTNAAIFRLSSAAGAVPKSVTTPSATVTPTPWPSILRVSRSADLTLAARI